MRQKTRRLYKGAMLMMALALVITMGGLRMASAQTDKNNHESAPVWQEVSRQIKLNPANPAPPDVAAQLVSLEVAYRDFGGRQHEGIVEVNRALKDDVLTYFKYAYFLNFPIREVAVASDPRFNFDDNKLMAADITSCFNYRTIAGTTTPSQHGLGRACDTNPRENPYVTLDDQGNPVTQPQGASWLAGQPGTLHAAHPLIQLMESRGWTWGGRWTLQDTDGAVIDWQHLQKRAPAPAQATALPSASDKHEL